MNSRAGLIYTRRRKSKAVSPNSLLPTQQYKLGGNYLDLPNSFARREEDVMKRFRQDRNFWLICVFVLEIELGSSEKHDPFSLLLTERTIQPRNFPSSGIHGQTSLLCATDFYYIN